MNKPFAMRYVLICLMAVTGLIFSACNRTQPAADNGAVTHIDSITVYSDEAFKYLIDQEVTIYENELPDKHINVIYKPEAEVLKVLMNDSFSTVVLGRRLTERENEEIYKKSHLQTEEHSFAKDAIAIIANPSFAQDTLPYELVSKLIAGTSDRFKLVFEGNGSGVVSYMFAQFGKGSKPSAYAAKNTDELVEYLQKDSKTIGFIPFDKVSDEDDTIVRHLLKKVKLLSVSRPDSTGKIVVSTASQSEIADGSYPFARPVNFIQHSMDQKVGTGFANFLSRERSGRIVLKSGLVPVIMPQRVININTDTLK